MWLASTFAVERYEMNEKIKELAKQADMYARADNCSMLFENFQKRYTEKFAELIVKDVMQVVANRLPSNQYLDVADAVIEHYKD